MAAEEIPAAATISALESLIRKANEATTPTRRPRIPPPGGDVDPDELASILVKGRPEQRSGLAAVTPLRPGSGIPRQERSLSEVLIADLAPALTPEEVAVLADAIDTGEPVEIAYRERHRSVTRSVISGCQLSPPVIVAWCHLSDSERVFTVANIASVAAWPPE